MEEDPEAVKKRRETVYVNVSKLKPIEKAELGIPSIFSDSQAFFTMCSICCLLSLIIPLAVLLPLYLLGPFPTEVDSILLYVLIALTALGVLYLLYSAYPVMTLGILCQPPTPELANSLVCTK